MSTSCPGGIQPNPDIAGIGVRLAVYVQTLATAFLFAYSPDDSMAPFYSTAVTNISLTTTAFVVSATGQLDFYHAVLVTCLFFLPIAVYISGSLQILRRTSSHKALRNHMVGFQLCMTAQTVLGHAFAFWVWATAGTYGSQPSCNAAVRFSILGVPVQATGWFRILALVLICLSAFQSLHMQMGSLFISDVTLTAIWDHGYLPWLLRITALSAMQKERYQRMYEGLRITQRLLTVRITGFRAVNAGTSGAEVRERWKARARRWGIRRPRISQLLLSAANNDRVVGFVSNGGPGSASSFVLASAWSVVLICMIEQTICLNQPFVAPGEDQWAFGQILALGLTSLPVSSVLLFLVFPSDNRTTRRSLRFRVDSARNLAMPLQSAGAIPKLAVLLTVNDKDHASKFFPYESDTVDTGLAFDLDVSSDCLLKFLFYSCALRAYTIDTGLILPMLLRKKDARREMLRAPVWATQNHCIGAVFCWPHSDYPVGEHREVLYERELRYMSAIPSSQTTAIFSLRDLSFKGQSFGYGASEDAVRYTVAFHEEIDGVLGLRYQTCAIAVGEVIRLGRGPSIVPQAAQQVPHYRLEYESGCVAVNHAEVWCLPLFPRGVRFLLRCSEITNVNGERVRERWVVDGSNSYDDNWESHPRFLEDLAQVELGMAGRWAADVDPSARTPTAPRSVVLRFSVVSVTTNGDEDD